MGAGASSGPTGDNKFIITLYSVSLPTFRNIGNVYIIIKGGNGETPMLTLDPPTTLVMEYEIFSQDVGVPYILSVGHDGPGPTANWNCGGISIKSAGDVDANGEMRERWFPHYGSLVEKKSKLFFQAGLNLPQHVVSESVDTERKKYLEDLKSKWQWDNGEILPQHATFQSHLTLPTRQRFPPDRMFTFGMRKLEATVNLYAAKLAQIPHEFMEVFSAAVKSFQDLETHFTQEDRIDDLDEFKLAFQRFEIPHIPFTRWKSDEEFGRRMLNGANPVLIKRCTSIPPNFGVTPEMVQPLMPEGSDLLREMEDGFVYFADCKILEGIPVWDGSKAGVNKNSIPSALPRYVSPAMAMFHVNRSGKLLPIAIQLHQELGSPVWTPLDNEAEWQFAKLYYKCADSQVHQMLTHLLETHLIVEPFAVSVFRNLPPMHPVSKLLYHHLKGVVAINTFGRIILVAPGGLADQIISIGGGGHIEMISKSYLNEWDYLNFSFPNRLRRRGVEDPSKLPGYYYRDDGMALWDIMWNFCHSFLSATYGADPACTVDDAVQQDVEVQAWIREVHDHGLCKGKNVPDSFQTFEQLIECVTSLIWQCSAGHASVNFSQYEHYCIFFNAPLAIVQPVPTEKGKADMDQIFKLMPPKFVIHKTIQVMDALSSFSKDDKFLGEYPDNIFNEDVRPIVAKFLDELNALQVRLSERNERLTEGCETTFDAPYDVPYVHMMPSRVPNSIAM